jgi:type III secretory pathway component EscU
MIIINMEKTEIILLEKQLRDAQKNGDYTVLAKILSKKLIYIHSTAYLDNYDSYLEKIKNKILVYKSIDAMIKEIQMSSEVAILLSHMTGEVEVLSKPVLMNSLVTTIWIKENKLWSLYGFQSTKIE